MQLEPDKVSTFNFQGGNAKRHPEDENSSCSVVLVEAGNHVAYQTPSDGYSHSRLSSREKYRTLLLPSLSLDRYILLYY